MREDLQVNLKQPSFYCLKKNLGKYTLWGYEGKVFTYTSQGGLQNHGENYLTKPRNKERKKKSRMHFFSTNVKKKEKK